MPSVQFIPIENNFFPCACGRSLRAAYTETRCPCGRKYTRDGDYMKLAEWQPRGEVKK